MSPRVGRALRPPPPSRPLPGLSFPEQGSPRALGGRRAERGPAPRAWGQAGPGTQSRDGLARHWETHRRPFQHHGRGTGESQHAPAPRKDGGRRGAGTALLPAPDPRGQANTGRTTSCSPGPCSSLGSAGLLGPPGARSSARTPASQGRGSLGSVGRPQEAGQAGAAGTELPPGPAHATAEPGQHRPHAQVQEPEPRASREALSTPTRHCTCGHTC